MLHVSVLCELRLVEQHLAALTLESFNGSSLFFLQEVKHIGSTHNRSALPFTGFGSKVVTNQYNSPSGLYSSDSIKDFNSAVDEVKTVAAANDSNSKYDAS